MNFNIYLVSPRWYCAGVSRAIRILDETIKKYANCQNDENDLGAPWGWKVYVNHEIIHNKYIIDFYKKKWVIFEEKLENISEGSNLIISAHWIWPETLNEFKRKKLNIIDAVCPLVNRVHIKAKKLLSEWKKIIYIWKKWHQEAIWVIENWKENIFLIQNISEIENLNFKSNERLAILTQTTLSTLETAEIIEKLQEKFEGIEIQKDDICYATTNRQKAVMELTKICDLIIIVWSKNSSNSNKLREISGKNNVKAILIDSYTEIDLELLKKHKKIWVSSGASAPEILVSKLIDFLKQNWWKLEKRNNLQKKKTLFLINIINKNFKNPFF